MISGDSNESLDRLLVRYRAACPDSEPGASFTPGLWKRIESRRGISSKLRIYARTLITAAATACALMIAIQLVPVADRPSEESFSYVDALGRDAETELVSYASVGVSNPAEAFGER